MRHEGMSAIATFGTVEPQALAQLERCLAVDRFKD
ncbi:MAG: hypothetical protein QOD76_1244 [Solirubrobacteraceae bacterium]|jgi:hypothetical protein|nr:hypothetical protein [Solirubrobacteraceae bacterium]